MHPYMHLHVYAMYIVSPLFAFLFKHQVDRMEKQLQSVTDSAMSYKSIYAKSAKQMAREAMEVEIYIPFLSSSSFLVKSSFFFWWPIFYLYSFTKCFFDQACEQEAASSKKVCLMLILMLVLMLMLLM